VADLDVIERAGDVDHPPRRHVETGRMEQPAKANEVSKESAQK
jgi:hypothetical protein